MSGSHDNSLRLWERTEEPLILSEEREIEREMEFEEDVVKNSEPVVSAFVCVCVCVCVCTCVYVRVCVL